MKTIALDRACDVRYQKDPSTGEGTLLYSTEIDVGGMISSLPSLFFNYENRHYEFFDIELTGWKRYRAKNCYVYYIAFKKMRHLPIYVYEKEKREKEVGASAMD